MKKLQISSPSELDLTKVILYLNNKFSLYLPAHTLSL